MKADNKKIIYVPLQGRIGNQLFIYAFAKSLQEQYGSNTEIVIDDSDVLRCNWINSLKYYDLKGVNYIHENQLKNWKCFKKKNVLRKIFHFITKKKDFQQKFIIEKKWQKLLNRNGLILCENGYIPYKLNTNKDVYIDGYFQSEKYFLEYKEDIQHAFRTNQFEEVNVYPNIKEIRERNTVCISIKVEHNVGSELYDVCNLSYWKQAIAYIVDHVDNPLFFICSDNVQYVVDKLINTTKFDFICQSKEFPVHVSLAVMSECKHFIIGNTTFGWWAQYLAKNENKIVIAPSKWMLVDMPIDIYQENWRLIEV